MHAWSESAKQSWTHWMLLKQTGLTVTTFWHAFCFLGAFVVFHLLGADHSFLLRLLRFESGCNCTPPLEKTFSLSRVEFQLCDHSNSEETCFVLAHHFIPWLQVFEVSGKDIELFQMSIHCFMLCSHIWFHFPLPTCVTHVRCFYLVVSSVPCITFNFFVLVKHLAQSFPEDCSIILSTIEGTIDPDCSSSFDANGNFALDCWSIQFVGKHFLWERPWFKCRTVCSIHTDEAIGVDNLSKSIKPVFQADDFFFQIRDSLDETPGPLCMCFCGRPTNNGTVDVCCCANFEKNKRPKKMLQLSSWFNWLLLSCFIPQRRCNCGWSAKDSPETTIFIFAVPLTSLAPSKCLFCPKFNSNSTNCHLKAANCQKQSVFIFVQWFWCRILDDLVKLVILVRNNCHFVADVEWLNCNKMAMIWQRSGSQKNLWKSLKFLQPPMLPLNFKENNCCATSVLTARIAQGKNCWFKRVLMTLEMTWQLVVAISLQQNRQLESNKAKSSTERFVKNATTRRSTMHMHIHTSWKSAKRIHQSLQHLSLGNSQRWNSLACWSSVNAVSMTGRFLATTVNSMTTTTTTTRKQRPFHLQTLQETVNQSNVCTSLFSNSPMSLRKQLVTCPREPSKRAFVTRALVLLQHHALLPERRGCKASSKTIFACCKSTWTWKREKRRCQIKTLQTWTADWWCTEMHLTRQRTDAWSWSERQESKTNSAMELSMQGTRNTLMKQKWLSKLECILHSQRQEMTTMKMQNQLILWSPSSVRFTDKMRTQPRVKDDWSKLERMQTVWSKQLTFETSHCKPSICSSVCDCLSSSWFLIRLSMGRLSWCERISPGRKFLLLSSTTTPLKASVGSAFKCPLLHCVAPSVLASIGSTSNSAGDQRSLEQERPSLSFTKLCNLAAAPQMSVRHSRCTPIGLQKICHLVVSNPNAISTLTLSWLKWKVQVWLVEMCFMAPLNGIVTLSESGWALSPARKNLSGRLSTHCLNSTHLLNALASLVLPGPMTPKWMNQRSAFTTAWTLTPHLWWCPLKWCAVLSTFFGLWMQQSQPSMAPTQPWNTPKAPDFSFHSAAECSSSSVDQGTSMVNESLTAWMNSCIFECATEMETLNSNAASFGVSPPRNLKPMTTMSSGV